MLRPGNQNPGPFKPRPVPVPPRVPPADDLPIPTPPPLGGNPGPFKPTGMPRPRPVPAPIFNQYPGPMKPPEVPLPSRGTSDDLGSVGGVLSPGAGFGQNDVLEAIFSRLGY